MGVKTTNCRGAIQRKHCAAAAVAAVQRKGSFVKVASSVVKARREREFGEGQQQREDQLGC